MSQGQPVAKSRGLWAPRTRLKIFAGIVAAGCFSLVVQLMADFQIMPRWVDFALLGSNALAAVMLWIVASAARPSLMLASAALGAVLARLAVGGIVLAYTHNSVDGVVVTSVLFGVATLTFVVVTIRAIRAESSVAGAVVLQPR